jgi:hypothetical protein
LVRGVILWRLNSEIPFDAPLNLRLTPQWHICPGAFIPVKRCHAGSSSLVATLASLPERHAAGSRVEQVQIGSLKGT